MIWIVLAMAVCVLVEGFFSGSETGFYSLNRLRLRSRVEAGWRGAAVLQWLLDRPDTTIMTMLVGTNVMVYLASALATELLSGYAHAELLATVILAPVIFVFGEMIPKDVFRRRADSLMYALAGLIDAFRVLVWPVTAGLRGLVFVVTRSIPAEQRGMTFSRATLREWIAEARREGVLSDYQQALSLNVMDLPEKKVASAMIPLAATKMVQAELRGQPLREAVRSAGHSRLPVWTGSRDNVNGILHALLYACASGSDSTAAALARPPLRVKETDGLEAALVALRREQQHMAVVLDARGRATGIVTLKDLVEEVVGELHDF